MNLSQAKQDELDARMAVVRGYRDKTLTDEERLELVNAHKFAKAKVRIARAVADGPPLTQSQKREIVALL